jgi:para-nitrobenzyl esterase
MQDGVQTFLGLPYAAPPVGVRRFRAPDKPAVWSGVREAVRYGPSCPQNRPGAPGRPPPVWVDSPDARMDEDCLYLNIWTTPPEPPLLRPVMVWIHTGGFVSGSGSAPLFQGDRLARRGDVLVVSINHRLGVLGFLKLDHLDPAFAGTSNLGMRDIIAALEWIRDNIEAFGGDPARVTIFGESGGGLKVSTLLAMPAAKGLFHRAIVQSGPRLRHLESERSKAATAMVLDALANPVSPAAALAEATSAQLLAAEKAASAALRGRGPGFPWAFSPIVDEDSAPADPFDPGAPACSAHVPLLIGYNKSEATYFQHLGFGRNDLDMTRAEAADRLRPVAGEAAEALLSSFAALHPRQTDFDTYIEAFTEFPTGEYSRVIAERKSAQAAAPVFTYRFDWPGSIWRNTPGATHMIELPFVFDAIDRAPMLVPETAETTALAANVSAAWCAFAHTGDPSTAQLPRWPRYNSADPKRMLIDLESKIAPDLSGPPRAIMRQALALPAPGERAA